MLFKARFHIGMAKLAASEAATDLLSALGEVSDGFLEYPAAAFGSTGGIK